MSNVPTDMVLVDSLHLSANVGPDCWNRIRPQPIEITVFLHLQNGYLTAAGESDDVLDSIHYGHLSKAISTLVEGRPSDSPFDGVHGLIAAVTGEAFALAKTAATEVRLVVELPKFILLAGGFSVDVTTSYLGTSGTAPRKVTIKDLVLPVLIGVNPPEREAKQRVVTNITFLEAPGAHPPIDYPTIASRIIQACFLASLYHKY